MTMIDIPFLVAQATAPLFYVGPFGVSRSIDLGTLIGGFVILGGLLGILRKLERRWDIINRVVFGEMDPDGRTVIRVGLVEGQRLIENRVHLIEEECPVFHQHRRKEDGRDYLHLRRQDRASDNGAA